MYLIVLPVSGGGFTVQLAIIQHLCEVKIVPNVILSSSGGNVAAYVASAADWKWSGIERIASKLSQNLFIKPWSNISLLSLAIGYFKGNVYDKGKGIYDFLSQYFNEFNISKYEIWTGTYNKNKQKARLFCNVSSKRTAFDISCIDYELTQSMEPVFADGNIELIIQAGIASISIPSIVPPQKIFNEEYVDGGVANASPLTIMQEPILKYLRDTDDSLHIIYINSVDLSSPKIDPIHNVIDNWKQTTHDLIRFQTVFDRLIGYEILRCQSGNIYKREFNCNYENLKKVKELYSYIRYSMLEIYPKDNFDVNITKFNGDDVLCCIHKAYSNCSCRLWFVINELLYNIKEINRILSSIKE